MTPDSPHIAKLLEKYFSGECSVAEQEIVRAWLVDPTHVAEAEQFMQEKWAELPDDRISEFPKLTQRRYALIRDRIQVKRRLPAMWYYAAASVVALLTVGIGYWFQTDLLNVIDPVRMMSYKTGPGQQLSVQLPDGSKVWLNASSTLRYPDKFRGDTRDVLLHGEGFFEVQHDDNKPFYVHTPGFYTRVLGTSFDVNVYPGGERHDIQVTVATGKVAVGEEDSLRGRQELAKLLPNQRGRYDRVAKAFYQDSIAAEQITAWREGRLVFRQASLKEMVATLERWYGVSIDVEAPGILECSFTADYRSGISLRDILEALRITGKIEYEMKGSKVTIRTRDGCL